MVPVIALTLVVAPVLGLGAGAVVIRSAAPSVSRASSSNYLAVVWIRDLSIPGRRMRCPQPRGVRPQWSGEALGRSRRALAAFLCAAISTDDVLGIPPDATDERR